jgi:hypothetical protein
MGRGFSAVRGDLVWWLIHRDGGESFKRFWRSDLSLDEAATQAFGKTLPDLLGDFAVDQWIVTHNGPHLPEMPWMVLFWIGAPLALAAIRSRRQTVNA